MAGPGCPKDGAKEVQDGVKVIHAQLLWEIRANPSCYKVFHWPILHDAKYEWGSGTLYVHKTEALAGLWPALFSKMAKNNTKGYHNTSRASEKHLRALSTYNTLH